MAAKCWPGRGASVRRIARTSAAGSAIGLVVAVLATALPAHGQTTYTWLGTTSTDPTVSTNWSGTAFTAFGTSSNSRLNIYNGTSASTALEYTAALGTTTLASTQRALVIGNTGNDGGRLRITGGTLSIAGSGASSAVGANGKDGGIEITGGRFEGDSIRTLELGGIVGGSGGTGTLTVSGGEAILPTVTVPDSSGSTATINLDGGTFTLGTLTVGTAATGKIRFNGGTLRPSVASATFLQNLDEADVRDGGAVIDTDGFDVGLPQVLRHSQIGGDAAIDGGLRKLGAGTLTLSAANTFTGPTVVEAGTLLLADSLALQASTYDTGSVGTFSFGSLTAATFGALSGSGGLVLENSSSAPLTLSLGGGDTTSSYSAGNLSGGGGLAKVGTGTLTLSGTNSYSGTTAVNAGTLAITTIDALPGYTSAGQVSVDAAATLMVPNAVDNSAVDAILTNGTFASDGRIGFDTSDGDRTYATAITGSKGLVKAGGNTLTISASNTLATIRVMGGTLKATTAAAWGGSGGLILNEGTFEYVPPSATAGSLSRTVTLEGNGSLRIHSPGVDTQFQVGTIAGTGQLTLLGGDGLFVRSAGSYTGGTIVKPGARVAVIGNSAGTAGAPTAGPFGTGTLRLEGGGLRSTTGGERTIGNATTLAGNVEFISAGANQDQNLVFSGPVTIEGATRTLTVNSSVNTGAGATGIFFNGVIDDGGNDYGLTKAGPGTLVLGGANTYGGATTVSAGTLKLGVAGAVGGSSDLSIASGASLDVSAISGGLTLGLGQSLGGAGSILGDLVFGSGSLLVFSTTDTLAMSGGTASFFAGTPGSRFGIDDLVGISSSTPTGTYTLISGTVDTANLDNLGSSNAFDLGGGTSAYFQQGSLQVIVVPEPESLAAVAAGLAALAAAFRRRARPVAA
jgi:fibronectin-binding autotransporter adhesin